MCDGPSATRTAVKHLLSVAREDTRLHKHQHTVASLGAESHDFGRTRPIFIDTSSDKLVHSRWGRE
jgi:hypothetical protein